MPKIPKVILFIESSRAPDQGLLRGIARYSRLHGPWSFYRKLPTYFQPQLSKQALLRLKDWGPDGIITVDFSGLQNLIDIGVPIIIAEEGRNKKEPRTIPHIQSNSEAIGKMAAEYFLNRGFSKFAFCGFGNIPWSQHRSESFAKRIAEAGFETSFYIKRSKIRSSWEKERTNFAHWLEAQEKPLAILACNDDFSQEIVETCKISNLHIPVEVAILGVDNDEFICDLSNPPLSSIVLNTEKAGYLAAELLDNLMKGEKMLSQTVISQPTHIVTRQSTDILSIEDQDVADAMRFILQNANKAIQVTDVVDVVSVSRRAIERRFRKILGYPIYKAIRRIRIENVCRMLVETHLSISEIARSLGSPSVEHIARYFRKEKGMSLVEYRKLYGNK